MSRAAGSFDGVYTGSRTVLHANSGCDASRTHTSLVIRDNHFERHWGSILLSIYVANDGTFKQFGVRYNQHNVGIDYVGSVKGKITGGDLEADIGNDDCMVHLSLKKT